MLVSSAQRSSLLRASCYPGSLAGVAVAEGSGTRVESGSGSQCGMADRPGRKKKEKKVKKKKFRLWKRGKKAKGDNFSDTPDSQESLSSQFYQKQSVDGQKTSSGSLGKVTLLALSLEESTETEKKLSVDRPSVDSYVSRERTSGNETPVSPKPKVFGEEKKVRLNVSALKTREKIQKRREEAMARKSKEARAEPSQGTESTPLVEKGNGDRQAENQAKDSSGCCSCSSCTIL